MDKLITKHLGKGQQLKLDTTVIYYGRRELGLPRSFERGSYERLSHTAEQIHDLQEALGHPDLFSVLESCPRVSDVRWSPITLHDLHQAFVCLVVSGGGYNDPGPMDDTVDLSDPANITEAEIRSLDQGWYGIPSYMLLEPRAEEITIRRADLVRRLQEVPTKGQSHRRTRDR